MKQFGPYQIISELGRGGMAVVYRALQPSVNRIVALKVLPPPPRATPSRSAASREKPRPPPTSTTRIS